MACNCKCKCHSDNQARFVMWKLFVPLLTSPHTSSAFSRKYEPECIPSIANFCSEGRRRETKMRTTSPFIFWIFKLCLHMSVELRAEWVRCYLVSDNRLMSDNTGPHSWWYQMMDNQPTNPGPLPSQAIFFQFNIRESDNVCQAAKTSPDPVTIRLRG